MTWNRMLKATHVGLDVLTVGVNDATVHFNIGEIAGIDIMELLNNNLGFYMTKCCRSFNIRRKRPFIYRMLEP